MSSVFNFLKNKIKKCTASKSTEAAASRCVSLNHTNQPTGNFKVKKRTKNMFNLKLKKNTNSSTIQHYITSDIVILSNEYSLSPLVNRSGYEHDQNQGIKELTNMVENDSALSASCVSPYSKINSNSSEFSSQCISNEWSNRSESHLMNASSKNYFLHEECEENTNDDSMVTYNSKYAIEDTPGLVTQIPSRKNSMLKRQSKFIQENILNRSLSTNDELCYLQTSALPQRVANASRRKCRRSNTTVAANPKSSSIIDYFNKLELINPVRRKERKNELICSAELIDNHVVKVSNSSLLNTTDNKNDMEKIQDLFFEDDDTRSNISDEFNNCFNNKNKNMALSSYMDSPVSSLGSNSNGLNTPLLTTPSNSDCDKTEASFFINHVPSSSPASIELEMDIDERKSNKTCNNSIEKLRRSISTPGLKDINTSIFSNISHIQIKECESVHEADFNNNKEMNLCEKIVDPDSSGKPQFMRGCKARSSKNIKQLFKNVVKLQMNALNSLEKFYETQLNKLETDRNQNLKLNPVYASKINEFYDRQLELLEERIQSNLTLICENKRNRLSTASSSSTIAAVAAGCNVNYSAALNSYLLSKNSSAENKLVKINSNDLKQRPANSKILNDLKQNLKNQNSLLPSKNYRLKQNDLNESQSAVSGRPPIAMPFQQLKRGDWDNETEEYSVAKFRSPKLSALTNANKNKFYKKQSILQSPQVNEDSFNLDSEIPAKFQYQKNKIKRYSTSNENLAQITKVHHVKNNLARIVKLNKSEVNHQDTRNLNDAFRHIKKHQSVCSLDPENDFDFKATIINEKIRHFICSTDFKPIEDQSMFDCDYPFETNNHLSSRLSDSHLLYELRQQMQYKRNEESNRNYQKKCSKSILYETKV